MYQGSLSRLPIDFIELVIEEVHLLLIIEVESVSSFNQLYSFRHYLRLRILGLSDDFESLRVGILFKVESLLFECILNTSASLLFVFYARLLADFLKIHDSVDATLNLVHKNDSLSLKF